MTGRGKKRKALWALLTVFCCVFSLGASVSPTREFYVNDYANVLSAEHEAYILDRSASLEKETGAQIVVLTVSSLEGKTPQQYALEVGRDWGIGSAEKNNGLLLLLAVEDRQIRVEVGPGLEGALNDAKVGRLIDNYAFSYYQENDFDTGTYELYNALLSVVMQEYGLEGLPGYTDPDEGEDLGLGSLWGVLAILIVVVVIYFLIGRGGSGRGGGRFYGPGPFMGGGFGGGFKGGGFGGGGFGGGGGFSGGGGGFRGGGAGRGF